MINRGTIWILCMAFLLGACSEKTTKPPPDSPIEPIHLVEGYPSWSPDGRYIYYTRPCRDNDEMYRYGTVSIWAYDIPTGHYGFLLGPAVYLKANQDGTILAFNWQWTLFFYYRETRTVRQVTHGIDIQDFDWSPSGNRLILGGGMIIDTLGNIMVPALLPGDGSHGGWCGVGWGDWFEENRILGVSADLSYGGRDAILVIDTLGQIIDTVLIHDIPRDDHGGFAYVNMSPDQLRVVTNYIYATPDGRLKGDFRLLNRDGSLIRILAENGGGGRWSPDGSKIVFHKYTWMGDNPDSIWLEPDYSRTTVWICNPDGSDMRELLGWPQPLPDTTMFDGGYNWVTDTYDP